MTGPKRPVSRERAATWRSNDRFEGGRWRAAVRAASASFCCFIEEFRHALPQPPLGLRRNRFARARPAGNAADFLLARVDRDYRD